MALSLPEVIWLIFTFVLGLAVGSFLNVVVGRLPLEKSLLWPNSRCLSCLRPLGLMDNLPVVGWLLRRGRCRYCGSAFSSRYLWVELACGIGFAGLFYFELIQNWHGLPALKNVALDIQLDFFPGWPALVFFAHHATLFSLLLAAALCDWDHKAIPLSLTVTGTLIGLVSATCFPWPFPNDVALVENLQDPVVQGGIIRPRSWSLNLPQDFSLPIGVYPWPVWGPVPPWLHENRWALGLVTGLTGAAVGMALIRAAKFLFERGLGKEALGLGDADLMMMAGAFLGWQPVVAAFFIGAMVSLPVGIVFRVVKGEQAFPFGPGLALGVFLTWMWWPSLGKALQGFLFEEILILVAASVLIGGLFVGSVLLRMTGFGPPKEAQQPVGAKG
jgi:leader peptidase (prepilin peptidase)/N-methyltransferase